MFIVTVRRHDVENCMEDNCFKCKMATFSISAAALPTRKPEVRNSLALENDYKVNSPAYARLRKEGFQPKSVMTAARVEAQATSRFEIESGHRLSSAKVGKKYDEVQSHLKDGGLLPLKHL